MKKEYTTPYAEKINFNYKDQVVASDSSSDCFFETTATHSALGCKTRDGEGHMNN